MCEGCGHEWDDLVLREHQDNLQLCPECKEEKGKRCMRKPPGITKESFVDGHKRKGFQDLKEANKLTMKMYSMKRGSEEREALNKEVQEIKKKASSEDKEK